MVTVLLIVDFGDLSRISDMVVHWVCASLPLSSGCSFKRIRKVIFVKNQSNFFTHTVLAKETVIKVFSELLATAYPMWLA